MSNRERDHETGLSLVEKFLLASFTDVLEEAPGAVDRFNLTCDVLEHATQVILSMRKLRNCVTALKTQNITKDADQDEAVVTAVWQALTRYLTDNCVCNGTYHEFTPLNLHIALCVEATQRESSLTGWPCNAVELLAILPRVEEKGRRLGQKLHVRVFAKRVKVAYDNPSFPLGEGETPTSVQDVVSVLMEVIKAGMIEGRYSRVFTYLDLWEEYHKAADAKHINPQDRVPTLRRFINKVRAIEQLNGVRYDGMNVSTDVQRVAITYEQPVGSTGHHRLRDVLEKIVLDRGKVLTSVGSKRLRKQPGPKPPWTTYAVSIKWEDVMKTIRRYQGDSPSWPDKLMPFKVFLNKMPVFLLTQKNMTMVLRARSLELRVTKEDQSR